jgi:hypothetical protein
VEENEDPDNPAQIRQDNFQIGHHETVNKSTDEQWEGGPTLGHISSEQPTQFDDSRMVDSISDLKSSVQTKEP